ncbi:MAG TPA: DUF72 domain-containing protein [Puia sp.]|nr:DUF72 domain-containing protein [Puia sp.]
MTERVLQSVRGVEAGDDMALRVYVGGTGWGQTNWLGKVYPRGTKPKDFLGHYVRQFNSIELNALWYNLQPKPVIERWAALAGPAFRFCPKFSNTISHEHQLKGVDRDTALFIDHMRAFGVTLGAAFLQLPESYGPERATVLHEFLRGLPRDFLTCVELRNQGWFGTAAVRATWELMFELGIGAVITDTPGRRDVLHMRLTAPVAFIRFVSNNLHPADLSRIDEWGERLGDWVEKGLRHIYFFVHDTGELFSPEMCGYAVKVFNKRFGAGLKPPQLIGEEPPAKELTLF